MMSNTAAVASPSTDPQDVNRVFTTPRPPSNNDNDQNSSTAPVPPGNGTGNSTGNGTTGTPGNGTTTISPGNGISNGSSRVTNNSPVSADDSSVYVPKYEWFEAIQERLKDWNEGDGKRLKIIVENKLYAEDLYRVCAKSFDLFNLQPEFQQKKINKSQRVRVLAKWVILNRKLLHRSDVDTIEDTETKEMINNLPDTQQQFFLCSQREFVQMYIDQYSSCSKAKRLAFDANDKIRFAAVMFHEGNRERIPLLFPYRHKMDRNMIDRRSMELRTLWNDFTRDYRDEDKVFGYPDSWESGTTIAQIPEHAKYSSNDKERMKTIRTEKDLKRLQIGLFLEYKRLMQNYKNDTGGGSGDPARIGNWKERDPLSITHEHYMGNHTSHYLTFLFMFDKQHEFPMQEEKGPLPGASQVDDDISAVSCETNSGRGTPLQRMLSSQAQTIAVEGKARVEELKNSTKELMSLLHEQAKGGTGTGEQQNNKSVTEVVNNREMASTNDLEWAQKEIAKESKDNDNRIDAVSKQLQVSDYEKEQCKTKRDRDGYNQARNRKRRYISQRDDYDIALEKCSTQMRLINVELTKRMGCAADTARALDSSGDLSDGSFDNV